MHVCLGNCVVQWCVLLAVVYRAPDNSLNCRAALVGSPHLAHDEPRRVFEFLNYSLCDGMLPVAYSRAGIIPAIESAPNHTDLCARIERRNRRLRTLRSSRRCVLVNLERRPLEGDTNECRPKFLIDKVQISVTLDCILDISLSNCKGSFRSTST